MIDLWRIDIELLDDRARALIVPDKVSNLAVRADLGTKQVQDEPKHQKETGAEMPEMHSSTDFNTEDEVICVR